jgi:hypothetical protein
MNGSSSSHVVGRIQRLTNPPKQNKMPKKGNKFLERKRNTYTHIYAVERDSKDLLLLFSS